LKYCVEATGTTLGADLNKDGVAKAYARWAPIYDLVFGAVFDRGRKASIAAAERIGGRILEVGVGTGLSLPDYSSSNRLIGVDLSAPMLRKAKERVAERGLINVDGLAVMDAQNLGFADSSFDVVVAQYVITTVPDAEATLDEFARVTRPGGEIILVNHLGAEDGLRADCTPARLARCLPLGAAGEMGGTARRRRTDRAAGDAAARTFLADPVRQGTAQRELSVRATAAKF
jgi:phosphatidylethanolamine/phosphatidyl-N-methylethanolamine N-methyltransferase